MSQEQARKAVMEQVDDAMSVAVVGGGFSGIELEMYNDQGFQRRISILVGPGSIEKLMGDIKAGKFERTPDCAETVFDEGRAGGSDDQVH